VTRALLVYSVRNVITQAFADAFLLTVDPYRLPTSKPTSNNRSLGLTTLASTSSTALYTSVRLFKTAITEVSSYTTTAEVHILFNEGAQHSFITQQLADKLHLLPTSHKTISVSSFGAQISPSRTLAVATILVHPLNGTRIQILVLIVLRTCRTYQKCACSLACYP